MTRNQRWGFIDKDGQEVIPCIYESDKDFNGGLLAVKKGGYWGFIDKAGDEVIPCKYLNVDAFSEGFAAVEINGGWTFIDKDDNIGWLQVPR